MTLGLPVPEGRYAGKATKMAISRQVPGDAVRARARRARALACVLAASALLAGCEDRSMADLESYAAEVLARKGGQVEPLPEINPYEVYTFQATGEVDPFKPFFQEQPEAPKQVASSNGIQPDFNRIREELESTTLDSLRMVGTLEQDAQVWGIVRSPDGVIHRVQVGNYMGKNHGRIKTIGEDRIDLVEIIPDGQGGWQEREASLALVE
jgi:type IV pilus assembly protein PilP